MTDVTTGDWTEAGRNLKRIPEAYERGLTLLAEQEAIIPSSWSSIDRIRSGKPSSRPPTGTDLYLRSCLIRCAQLLMASIRDFHAWDWPTPAWQHDGLVYTHRGLVLCDANGKPEWRDCADLSTPIPRSVDEPVSQLRAIVGALQGLDWGDMSEQVDAFDRAVARDGLRTLGSAVDRLKQVGVWAFPRSAVKCVVCVYGEPHAKNRCEPCYRYLKRTGSERPRELWEAA